MHYYKIKKYNTSYDINWRKNKCWNTETWNMNSIYKFKQWGWEILTIWQILNLMVERRKVLHSRDVWVWVATAHGLTSAVFRAEEEEEEVTVCLWKTAGKTLLLELVILLSMLLSYLPKSIGKNTVMGGIGGVHMMRRVLYCIVWCRSLRCWEGCSPPSSVHPLPPSAEPPVQLQCSCRATRYAGAEEVLHHRAVKVSELLGLNKWKVLVLFVQCANPGTWIRRSLSQLLLRHQAHQWWGTSWEVCVQRLKNITL